ncbi:hypothetical protein ABZX92_45905, partial [Lentzea sp. NPDC006480]|uniref:hypothetical protein n=1 Tax=Lentzea sp. NPDC006480 TaxID=3157176 RepID=UPI0033AE4992
MERVRGVFESALVAALGERGGHSLTVADFTIISGHEPAGIPLGEGMVRIEYQTALAASSSDVSEAAAASALMGDNEALGSALGRVAAGTATPTDRVAVSAVGYLVRMWPDHGQVLDLGAVHGAIESEPDSALVWTALLTYLASLDVARGTITTVVDRYFDGGQWKHVVLPGAARDRFTVTGKGVWGLDGRVSRPVRLVPPGDVVSRVDLGTHWLTRFDIGFAGQQETPDAVGEQQADQFARWLAEVAVEFDGDGLPPLVAEFSGQGSDDRYLGSVEAGMAGGLRRAQAVWSRVAEGVRTELTRLVPATRAEELSAGVLSAEVIAPANRVSGTFNPSHTVVTVTAYPAANPTAPTTTPLPAAFAGEDEQGARRYFTAGQVRMRTLTDATGQITGVTFGTPDDPTILAHGFPVNRLRRSGLLMDDTSTRDTVPPISMAFPWDGDTKTFFVD